MPTKSKKRTPKHLPTYTHERTAYAGIRERLALASLAYSKTWAAVYAHHFGQYVHTVRMMGKTEGWEAHYMWTDNLPRIDMNNPGVRREIAHAIEGARAAYYENRHPSPALLAIVANVAARKVAA